MAIGRISGSVLKSNLTRNGTDLAFETNLLYLDVTNSRVGIGTSEPTTALHVNGDITVGTNNKLRLRDSGTYINSNADGDLDIVSDGTNNDAIKITSAGGVNIDANNTSATGVINLDANYHGYIGLKDNGTTYGTFTNLNTSNFYITSSISDADIVFRGNDGGSTISPLSIDMSAGGIIGIGTVDASYTALNTLTVNTSSDIPLYIHSTDANNSMVMSDTNGSIKFGTASGGFSVNVGGDAGGGTKPSATSHYANGASEKFAVSSAGVVTISGAYSLPTADGSSEQVIKTDGSGTLSFTTISTNSVSQGNSNVTVTDSGTGAITIAADGNTIITMNATTALDVSAVTNAIRLPNGTTGQRPSGSVGMVRYNSSTDNIEGYTSAGGWAQLGATSTTAENTNDTATSEATAISTTASVIDQFTTSSFDSAWYLSITRDEINNEVSTAKYSLVHNNSSSFVATSHITKSDTANTYITPSTDITGGSARLLGTGGSVVNSVSSYRIALGDNTTAGTTGSVTTVINTDVDSGSESIDSWAKGSYRAAKYYISVNNASKTEVTSMEALVVHDGTTAFISTYGVVNTGSNDLLSLTAAVDGSNVVVSASGNEPNLRVTSYRILLANAESGSTGDNVNAVADTTVSSTATAVDTFSNSVYTGAFYVLTGHNASEGSTSASEVTVVSNEDVHISTGPAISSKGTDQLTFSATQSGSTVTVKAASTSGASTTVNGYRVHMLRGSAGASTADTVLVSTTQTISGAKTFSNAVVMMPNLPTSDPGVAGQLWRSGTDLKISIG